MGPGARFLRIALAVAALGFLPWVLLAARFGAISGDLARVGAWSERDYGWRAGQPPRPVRATRAGLPAPDVLVLGDSFSMGNVWQSALSDRSGLETVTWGYDGHGCVGEFIDMAVSGRFPSARHVIVQTVERYLVERFEALQPCAAGAPSPYSAASGSTPALRPADPFVIDWRYLAKTAANTILLARDPRATVRGPEVVNVPLIRADLFSNRRADRLLYYAGDDAKRGWTGARILRAAASLAALQSRVEAAGMRFTLLVVPDKSTVYRPFVDPAADVPTSPEFATALREAGVRVVFPAAPLGGRVTEVVDLYMPDDTHLSTRGFELLAQAVADSFGVGTEASGRALR